MIIRHLRRTAFLFALLAAGAAGAQSLTTPDGVFSFGAHCNGTDCPAAHARVQRNGVTLNASGICMTATEAGGTYLMDGYRVWRRWSPGAGALIAAKPPLVPCNVLPYSPDGATLSTPGTGALITAAGSWSLGTTQCAGAYAILLNGTQAGGGCGKQLLVDQDGMVFTADATGNWWKWADGGWTNLHTTTKP
jgi:hypothetical protein